MLIILGKLGKLSPQISPDENIGRFIFNKKNLIDKGNGKIEVDSAAFLPAPKDNKTSVYRVTNCAEKTIWFLGYWFCEFLRNYEKKPEVPLDKLCGRADFRANDIPFADGIYEYQPTPHFRHMDIASWPTEKSAKKIKAIEISQRAAGIKVTPFKYKPSYFSLGDETNSIK